MVKLNQTAHDHAMAKIAKGDVDYSDVHPYDAHYNGQDYANKNGREAHAKWHLGTASVADASAKDPDNDGDDDTTPAGDTDHDYFSTQKYPVTSDFKNVSRAMVKHSAMMAANAEHTDVMQSCASLLNKMNTTKACATASTKQQAVASVKKDKYNDNVFEVSIFKNPNA